MATESKVAGSSSTRDEIVQKMIDVAFAMKNRAHCPYSKFRVGSAVLTKSGRIIGGCNGTVYGPPSLSPRIIVWN
jgi:cytidine deaminase